MRLITILASLFFSTTLLADPVVPPLIEKGTYAYQGVYRVTGHKHFEFVDISTEQGKQQVQELKADGYACFDKSDRQSICSKAVAVDQNDPVVIEQLKQNIDGMIVTFSEVVELELKQFASGYREWDAYQKTVIERRRDGEMKTTLYYLVNYVSSWGINSAFPGRGDNPDHDIFVPGKGKISINWNLSWQVDPSKMDTYVIDVTIPKVD